MARLVLVLALAGTACSPGDADQAGPRATPSPVPVTPSEDPTDDVEVVPTAPSPTAEPSATPTVTDTPVPSPSPSPTPVADETATPATDEDAALAAASARRAERAECGDAGIADDFHRVVLDRGDVLIVFAACFVGAYQANGELLAFDGTLRAWPVEQWVDGRVVELSEVVGDLSVAPDGALENLQRYRALGDCGLFQRWTVTGARVQLVEAREQQCSDDGLPVPPMEWPLVHGG